MENSGGCLGSISSRLLGLLYGVRLDLANIKPSRPQISTPQSLIRIPPVHVGYPTSTVDPSPDLEPKSSLRTCATVQISRGLWSASAIVQTRRQSDEGHSLTVLVYPASCCQPHCSEHMLKANNNIVRICSKAGMIFDSSETGPACLRKSRSLDHGEGVQWTKCILIHDKDHRMTSIESAISNHLAESR